MKQLLFKLLLFWYATKAKFWDFCLKKVLKHHPTHQYEYEQLVEVSKEHIQILDSEIFELSKKSPTYKLLFAAYTRLSQKLGVENVRLLVIDNIKFQDKIISLERQMQEQFTWKETKITTSK